MDSCKDMDTPKGDMLKNDQFQDRCKDLEAEEEALIGDIQQRL